MFSAVEEVIFALRTQGMSQKGIAARVRCSQSMVSRILKKDFPAPVNNGGRPKKTSPQNDRALKRIAHSNCFKSTTSITHLWNETMTSPVSRSTTYWRLWFHGFSSRIPCTKPLLSCKQKKKHLQFAQKYSKWTMEDWKQVIFSDESKFVMGYGNKGPRVWRQKYERHKAACLKRSVKHPASVMVWGCVSSQGVGSLCFLSPKTTVNTEVYIDLLDAYLLPSVDKLFADDDFVFQHDLAPAHRSYKTAKYLKEKRIDVLEWPCNSPDLNIIEFVWQKMKTRVQQVHLKTLEELKAVLREVWASFTKNELEEMVESMPRRIHEVIAKKGDATKF